MSGDTREYPLRCDPAPWEGEEDAGWTLNACGAIRCRRVRPSEIGIPGAMLDDLTEALDEELHSGVIGEAWGPYGDEMVTLHPGAKEAFAAWADKWVKVSAYLNEPTSTGGGS